MYEFILTLDFYILDLIQEKLASPAADFLMKLVSVLGGGVIWVVLGGVLFLAGMFRGNRQLRLVGIAVLVSLVCCILLTEFGLKLLFLRERPFTFFAYELIVSEPFGSSFPSSHTAQSFAAAIPVFRMGKHYGLCALCFAGLVGFSRLYLYVHFPSDILIGAIFGVICGVLFTWLTKLVFTKVKLL